MIAAGKDRVWSSWSKDAAKLQKREHQCPFRKYVWISASTQIMRSKNRYTFSIDLYSHSRTISTYDGTSKEILCDVVRIGGRYKWLQYHSSSQAATNQWGLWWRFPVGWRAPGSKDPIALNERWAKWRTHLREIAYSNGGRYVIHEWALRPRIRLL